MEISILLTMLFAITLIVGCDEPKADLSAPHTHRVAAITFQYPQNWRITEESATPEIHSITVETPGEAIVIFHSYPIADGHDLTTFS